MGNKMHNFYLQKLWTSLQKLITLSHPSPLQRNYLYPLPQNYQNWVTRKGVKTGALLMPLFWLCNVNSYPLPMVHPSTRFSSFLPSRQHNSNQSISRKLFSLLCHFRITHKRLNRHVQLLMLLKSTIVW